MSTICLLDFKARLQRAVERNKEALRLLAK